jgi:Ca2+-binding EF-hand superfamily protein
MMRLLVLSLSLAVAGVAFAQTGTGRSEARDGRPREPGSVIFDRQDINHDGKVTLAEFQQAARERQQKMFERLDRDRDGAITREESQALREGHREKFRERRGERQQRMQQLRGLDADGDQQLSRAEIGDKLPRLRENFARIDGNNDGKLSREELRSARDARHAQAKPAD